MLGAQSWFTALALPTVLGGSFIATRKRLAYQWREELMDLEGTAYPAVTDADMEFFRRVAPANVVEATESSPVGHGAVAATPSPAPSEEGALGVPLTARDNIGVNVQSNVLPPELCNVLLNEVQRWAQSLGHSLDPRKIQAIEERCQIANQNPQAATHAGSAIGGNMAHASSPSPPLDLSFLRDTRIIADHAEDIQPMKAPWGSGDAMRLEQMPASLRYLVNHTRQAFEGMGRLRHVYIEYAPSGRFYRAPRPPKLYDGHDYVIVPLRRDEGDTVVTLSPVLRSRRSEMREVARHSWTSRDVDALLPSGSMLRVYGTARYEWGWGMRPGASWFGSRLNPVRCPPLDGWGPSTEREEAPLSLCKPWQRAWWARLWSPAYKPKSDASLERSGSAALASAPSDAALVVFHFEGPRSSNKQRSLLLQPEVWIFGRAPSVETFETWYEDRPTEDEVKHEGLVRFMARNYLTMLTVS